MWPFRPKIKIPITWKDTDNADYSRDEFGYSHKCPIALACKQFFQCQDIAINNKEMFLYFTHLYRYVKLPAKATQFGEKFDQKQRVEPFTLELTDDLYEEYDR